MGLEGRVPMELWDLPAKLAAQIAKHRIPGASLAVLNGGTVYSASVGLANVPADIAVDDHTIFQIGSITKTFMTTLAMMLAEDGLLDLDAAVVRYIPDLRIAHRPCPETVTVRMLLNHTSGIDSDLFEDFGNDDGALGPFRRGLRTACLRPCAGPSQKLFQCGIVHRGLRSRMRDGHAVQTVF